MVPVLPDPSPLAERFHQTGHLWWALRTFLSVAVPALFALGGPSRALRAWAGRKTREKPVPLFLLYASGMLAFIFVLNIPVGFWGGYLRERAYGLSDQSLGKWASDQIKAFGVLYVLSSVAWGSTLWLVHRDPRRWWLKAGILTLPAFVLVMWVTPVAIAPLFNEFAPMKNAALEKRVLALAARAGVDADRVQEVKKNVDTRRMNAYVNGMFGTKRIVLFDTLVERLTPDQVLSVVGHELGHYVLDHLIWGTIVAWLVAVGGLFVVARVLPPLLSRMGPRAGAWSLSDPAVLPLALLVAQLYSLAVGPVTLVFSRHLEHEADRFALELTRESKAFMDVEADFVTRDLAYPRPKTWVKWLRHSHPPVGERFDFAKEYRPWETGQPLRYGGYFR